MSVTTHTPERIGRRTARPGDLSLAPVPFSNDRGERVVFADIEEATYRLRFDVDRRTAVTESVLSFVTADAGHPAIDFRQPVIRAELDGRRVALRDECPPGALPGHGPRLRSVGRAVEPGVHELVVEGHLTEPGPACIPVVRWDAGRVECRFDMSDRDGLGGYLGAFLPANYEFDHYRMTFVVEVTGGDVEPHLLVTNHGRVTPDAGGRWQVSLPAWFTPSCPWFHLAPARRYRSRTTPFVSDTQNVPVHVYACREFHGDDLIDATTVEARRALRDLETRFGPFPHPGLTVLSLGHVGTFARDMEYAGATTSGLTNLAHEINHSYFARGVVPVDGNAAWIDEAIAMWGEDGYRSRAVGPDGAVNIGGRSAYVMTTHPQAYRHGARFVAHLDHLTRDAGGLEEVLRRYLDRYAFRSARLSDFRDLVSEVHGRSLAPLFARSVCVNH